MRRKKKQRLAEEQFWGTFHYFNVPDGQEQTPAHLRRINFRIWESVQDEHLSRMITRVRSVDMLDLDETDITDEGVALLTQMDFIKELRLKGIHSITDECIPYLNQVKGLELLHIGGTNITLEGILRLGPLKELKKLLVSLPDTEDTMENKQRIAALFPGCEVIVNHKMFEPPQKNDWEVD